MPRPAHLRSRIHRLLGRVRGDRSPRARAFVGGDS
jgi:hypothetical protein